LLCTRLAVIGPLIAFVLTTAGRSNVLIHTRQATKVPTRHVLLVGVSEYPRLGPKYRLQGPPNDVKLMQGLLEAPPFNVNRSNIVSLAGWPSNPKLRPTRANIERAFMRLAAEVRKEDQVIVLMAGHGSQQPANDEPDDPEPDGLDEIFLPADTAGWNGQIGRVENAIVDDDIRGWVTELRSKGAFVWVVVDSCQSGTMVRGVPSSIERERQIPAEALIPLPVLERARQKARSASLGSGSEATSMGLVDDRGQLAALYAAQMHETTPERPLPDANGQIHGLFTYTLADVLAHSTTPLTYRELATRVLERYRSMGRSGPTPTFEGGGLDRLVLGQQSFPDRPRLLLGARAGSGWELRAGSIHGLTPGSVLQLFPPAGTPTADVPIGHVRVVSSRASTALVEPVAFDGVPSPPSERLVEGSRARIVLYDFGDSRLRVAVQGDAGSRGLADDLEVLKTGSGPELIERALAGLPDRTLGLAVRTDSAADADWLVRSVGGEAVLVPASGWIAAGPSAHETDVPTQFRVGQIADPGLARNLAAALQNIARARNLMRLAQGPSPDPDVSLKVQLLRHDSETPSAGRPLPHEASGLTLTVGEVASFQIKNDGSVPLDVTLLFINSGYGIQALYPQTDQEIDNRVQPGQTVSTMKFNVKGDTLGVEHVVAIGEASGQGPRVSFGILEQPTIDAFQTRSFAQSSLVDVLKQALYGGRTSRGMSIDAEVRHVFQMISWRTVPGSVSGR
jgi:hypothetical protein